MKPTIGRVIHFLDEQRGNGKRLPVVRMGWVAGIHSDGTIDALVGHVQAVQSA